MDFPINVADVPVEDVFHDALTNRIEAVAMGPSAGGRVLKAKPWSRWTDVEGT